MPTTAARVNPKAGGARPQAGGAARPQAARRPAPKARVRPRGDQRPKRRKNKPEADGEESEPASSQASPYRVTQSHRTLPVVSADAVAIDTISPRSATELD